MRTEQCPSGHHAHCTGGCRTAPSSPARVIPLFASLTLEHWGGTPCGRVTSLIDTFDVFRIVCNPARTELPPPVLFLVCHPHPPRFPHLTPLPPPPAASSLVAARRERQSHGLPPYSSSRPPSPRHPPLLTRQRVANPRSQPFSSACGP